ncbi:MAG: hypothetical protein L0Y71_23290 [Gemmataceae bacterium]|nr:hypothetical protein [Gemmataceae bacterium]
MPAPTTEKGETRSRWVYERGWFARGQGDAWFEHNDEARRIRGRPWEFRQTKSSTEHIELYDASRGVAVRLSETAAAARWDKDGNDAEWTPLYTGRWEVRK